MVFLEGKLPHCRSRNFNDAVYALRNCYAWQEKKGGFLFKLRQLEWLQRHPVLRLIFGLHHVKTHFAVERALF